MQVSDTYDDLGSIELDNFLREALLLQKDLVQLSTADERHDEV